MMKYPLKPLMLSVSVICLYGCSTCDFTVRSSQSMEIRLKSAGSRHGTREYMFQYDQDKGELYSFQVLYSKTNGWSSLPTVVRRYSLTAGVCGEWLLPYSFSPLALDLIPFSNARIAVVGNDCFLAQSKNHSAEDGGGDLVRFQLSGDRLGRSEPKVLHILPSNLICDGLVRVSDSRMLIEIYDIAKERRMFAVFDCNEDEIYHVCDVYRVAVSPDGKSFVALENGNDGRIALYDVESCAIEEISAIKLPLHELHGLHVRWINQSVVMFWTGNGSWWLYHVQKRCLFKNGVVPLRKDEYVKTVLGRDKFLIREHTAGLFQPNQFIASLQANGDVVRRKVGGRFSPKKMLTEDYFYAEE